jgi:hypothetical protein
MRARARDAVPERGYERARCTPGVPSWSSAPCSARRSARAVCLGLLRSARIEHACSVFSLASSQSEHACPVSWLSSVKAEHACSVTSLASDQSEHACSVSSLASGRTERASSVSRLCNPCPRGHVSRFGEPRRATAFIKAAIAEGAPTAPARSTAPKWERRPLLIPTRNRPVRTNRARHT